jgi:serine phosphatase RsbU (regulator of sigma subunit)
MTDELAYLGGITETATLFYGRLGRRDSVAWLDYCNAGHLHPLLRLPDGTVTVLDGGNRLLLGTLGTGAPVAEGQRCEVAMPAGSILLLYTDGLIERHGVSMADATQQLIRTLSSFDDADTLEQLCEQLLDSPGARDDTTVFAVRVTQ